MKKTNKIMGAVVLTAAGAFASSPAFAGLCTGIPTNTGFLSWSYFSNLGSTGCTQKDKLYSNFSILSGSAPTSNFFGQITSNSTTLDSSMLWSLGSNVAGLDFTIGYDVTLFNPADPNTYFSKIAGVAAIPAAGAFFKDTVTGLGGPYVLNAITDGMSVRVDTTGSPKTLSFSQQISSVSGGISSVTTTLSEKVSQTNNVPEPASIALFGIGLGLAFGRRSKL